MEFWESKHSSEPGCDRILSSWQPAQSCILFLGQGKQAKLSSSPLIFQQNWIPRSRLSPFLSVQCQRQLKYVSCTLEPLNSLTPMTIMLKFFFLRWCFSLWHFCTHPIPYSSHPCHCLISELQNTWGWLASWSKPSAQSRAGCRELCSVLNISKERDSTYDNHGTELFKQENGIHSFFINITSKSNSSTCKKDDT